MLEALKRPDLGWSDRRPIQLTKDIVLTKTLVISSPIHIIGDCSSNYESRCIITSRAEVPLLHISGPAAFVRLHSLDLAGGTGNFTLAGALTASDSAIVELDHCSISRNTVSGLRVNPTAFVTARSLSVGGNSASNCGGGIILSGGKLHLQSSTVTGNVAPSGGGVCVVDGGRLTAAGRTSLRGNRLSNIVSTNKEEEVGKENDNNYNNYNERAAATESVDLYFQGMSIDSTSVYFESIPRSDQLLTGGGGKILPLHELKNIEDVLPDDQLVGALTKITIPPFISTALSNKEEYNVNGDEGEADETGNEGRSLQQIPASFFAPVGGGEGDTPTTPTNPTTTTTPTTVPTTATTIPSSMLSGGGTSAGDTISLGGSTTAPTVSSTDFKEVAGDIEFAHAIEDGFQYIRLVGHVVLSDKFNLGQGKALLPPIKGSITVVGACKAPFSGKCLIDGQGLGPLIFADNAAFAPGVNIKFENVIFKNGLSRVDGGGAISNSGRMWMEFNNVDFVQNSAPQGGALNLVEGATGKFNNVNFIKNAAATDGSGNGLGGAVLLTGAAMFTNSVFEGNTALQGGAVAIGGSSTGVGFEQVTFKDNAAEIFGNDVYAESWVQTGIYFDPFPTEAQVYTSTKQIQPLGGMPPLPPRIYSTSPPRSPVIRGPPPGPPPPPNPDDWVYTEDELWDALYVGNSTITIAAHIMFSPGGKFSSNPPPPIESEVNVFSNCAGYMGRCIIDMKGSQFPIFTVNQNAILNVRGVRFLNAATLADGGVVQLINPKRVIFNSCEFVGCLAANGGAVAIKGGASADIHFNDCLFTMNTADLNGGAVAITGGSAFFSDCKFDKNRAKSGGAISLGPMSKAFILDANFTGNSASDWGDDIFMATPMGSTIYANQWPFETVASVFPKQADVKWYFSPPPAPPSPPSPPPGFVRKPLPNLINPPGRVKQPPPSPPNPPPNPPPRPPSPPYDHMIKPPPVHWELLYGSLLMVVIAFSLGCCLWNHKKLLPRIEDPEELKARLEGTYQGSSDEEEDEDGRYRMGNAAAAFGRGEEVEVVTEPWPFGTARFRRRGQQEEQQQQVEQQQQDSL